jgi:WhiB family transcriptional regulator, redox-sensing transcriptional regulator
MDQDLARAALLTLPGRVPRSRAAPESWREVGSCRESDSNLFYPLGKGLAARDQAEEAKRVCRTCPSREPCLAFALATRQELGVWGGTSPDERRLILRARRAQVAS